MPLCMINRDSFKKYQMPPQCCFYCTFCIYQSNDFCVDDSGRWDRFTALEVRSDESRKQYEFAGKVRLIELKVD